MGKKGKRQTDPSRDDCESTDSDIAEFDEDHANSCPHVRKAVALSNVKKTLKSALCRVGQCSACLKELRAASSVQKNGQSGKPLTIKPKTGKFALDAIKKEQLERAKAEQKEAASKLKKEREEPIEECIDAEKCDLLMVKSGECEASIKEGPLHSNTEFEIKSEEPKSSVKDVVANSIKDLGNKGIKPSVWLCLKCGIQGCAGDKRHSYGHFKQPRSDLHCLVVNVESFDIWCYECQKEIHVDSHKKLFEVVEFVKKIKANPTKTSLNLKSQKPVPAFSGCETLPPSKSSNNYSQNDTLVGLPKIKGLNNLGNTCFFNSIVQCLSQTHILTELAESQAKEAADFRVSGSYGSFETVDSLQDSFADLYLKLSYGGLTLNSLASFLVQMHNHGCKSSSISPGHLFGQVAKLSPKFRGMRQQDSHELLRYLMEALRNEEAKRQKSSILKHFGLNEKTDPKAVAKHLKRKLQVYGRSGNHTFFDRIFSGQFVSTIVCEECHHSSQNYEQFLDISLQVVEDKPTKPAKKVSDNTQADDIDGNITSVYKSKGNLKSKGQVKKEKERKRKEKRKNSTSKSEELKTELQGDEVIKSTIIAGCKVTVNSEPIEDEVKNLASWKDNFEGDDGNDEDDEDLSDDQEDSGKENPSLVEEISSLKSDQVNYSENVEGSKEIIIQVAGNEVDTGTSVNGDVEDNEDEDEDWVMSKNLLESISQLTKMKNTENLDPRMLVLCEKLSSMNLRDSTLNGAKPDILKSLHRRRLQEEWTRRTLTSLTPRYRSSSGECSIYSCLGSFTQSELLTGQNKWACESCTKLKSTEESKSVYSNASKQLLIFSPPAILTLHLKRFQQTLSGCKKVNKHVSFPTELDLASFCSTTSKSLPTVCLDQEKVLYSLYGVVEHSGSLHGGHYTAFVKVRLKDVERNLKAFFSPPVCKSSDIPWLFEEMDKKVRKFSAEDLNLDEETAGKANVASSDSVASLPKRWFHASDTSVSEVSEEKVMKAQAYLLFYERIL